MTKPDEHVLLRLIGSLAECAGQIDQTFSVAGAQLGQGLSVFEALKDSLGALSRELGGEDLQGACRVLQGLASELDVLSDNLPAETATLAAIATESSAASLALERLLGSMRLVGILARSARIEAASVSDKGQAFDVFADEIVALALSAQATVGACVHDHDGLSALLGSALEIQRDFETRYRVTLSKLAAQLRQTLVAVDTRQHESAALTQEAAVHSGTIAAAAGGAIMALQSGDAIRQRLEHSLVALNLAVAKPGPGQDLREALSPAGKEGLEAALRCLQEGQLDATAKTLRHDVLDIDRALLVLAEDTAPLMDLGRSLYGGTDASSSSFLQVLEKDLAEAADIIGKCQRARSGVAQVTSALTRSLDTLHATVGTLDETVASILLIGTNASLRAARLGQGGRSLVVIAQEMKAAAADIARDAARLNPVFSAMQNAARSLDRPQAAEGETFGSRMDLSLDAIKTSGHRLSDTLARLSREGGSFASVVAQARLMFSNAAATADVIQGGAAVLAQGGFEMPEIAAEDEAAIAAIFASVVRPTYTMVAEREIHDAVLARLALSPPPESPPAQQAQPDDALDDFLF